MVGETGKPSYISSHHSCRSHTDVGWPTDGNNYELAVPTLENAGKYWKGAVCGMLDWGVDVFAFEAFDEPNKPNSVGLDGISRKETFWGTHDAFTRKAKYDLSC
jgi:glucan 1,3-beta-glucosidase